MPKIIRNQDLTPSTPLSQDEKDWIYNGLDVCVTLEVYGKQIEAADEITLNTATFSRRLMNPIFEMNMRGVLIDHDARAELLVKFRAFRELAEHHLYRIVTEGVGFVPTNKDGDPVIFNWRSEKQLKQLFYGCLGIKPILKRNNEGIYVPTVDRDALEKIEDYFSARWLVAHVIALRELDKRIQFLETEIDLDGRARTSYNIAGTNTGRLSSSESDFGTGRNQQNIERLLRRIYVPDEGMKFCNIDLEQADARNVGAICWNLFVESHGEAFAGSYLDACESGDLHTAVCKMAWPDLDWPANKPDWRAIAEQIWYRTFTYRDGSKKLGHGTNYYGTPPTMAKHAKVDMPQIELFQERYFEGFPVIGAVKRSSKGRLEKDLNAECWHNWVRYQINQFGYLITPHFNRRRYFFGRPDDDRTIREAIAYAPQSMTADEIDTGIIRLWHWHKVQLLIQVHDSILFQFPEEQEDELVSQALEMIVTKMELKKGRQFVVPAEAKVGYNWAEVEYFSAEDERNGLGKKGEVKDNPSGLIKYKPGTDKRSRPHLRTGSLIPTLQDLLNGQA